MSDPIKKITIKPLRNKILGYLFIFGFIIINSAIIINPWMGKFWRKNIINYKDVMLIYFIFALVIGSIYIVLSLILLVKRNKVLENISILVFIITLIIFLDRILLLIYGLPVWQHDPELFFKHRPNQEKTWEYVIVVPEEAKNKLFITNQYGHHDDNFPIEKLANEFRGVILGDSVVNGDGLVIEETISSQLENILEEKDNKYKTYQIINTGVHGYSISQYRQALENSLKFKPDFIALGFVVNDVVESGLFDRNFGGPGFDIFRQTIQSDNKFFGYLLNSTGFGRLIVKKKDNVARWNEKVQENLEIETYSASHPPDDPTIKEAWERTFIELDKIQKIVKEKKIPFLLMIFPAEYQLKDESNKFIQKTLIEYAQNNNIDYIDFTPYFEEAVFKDIDEDMLEKYVIILNAKNKAQARNETKLSYDNFFEIGNQIESQFNEYYTDLLHYTPFGNGIISKGLFKYLEEKELIEIE